MFEAVEKGLEMAKRLVRLAQGLDCWYLKVISQQHEVMPKENPRHLAM